MREPLLLDINTNAVAYGRWLLPKDFSLRSEVLIAFSRKNGHMYLLAGKYEMHGHLIFMKTFSKLFTPRTPPAVVYIRLKNLTRDQIINLETYIESNQGVRHSSCINYVLITLFTSLGIKFCTRDGHLILKLKECLDAALIGNVQIGNEVLPVEVFRTENIEMAKIYDHFEKIEKRFARLLLLSRVLEKLSLGIWRKDIKLYYKAYLSNPFESILAIIQRYI